MHISWPGQQTKCHLNTPERGSVGCGTQVRRPTCQAGPFIFMPKMDANEEMDSSSISVTPTCAKWLMRLMARSSSLRFMLPLSPLRHSRTPLA